MQNTIIRCSIRTLYDMQKLRIQNGNRIVAAFRTKLGLESSQAEKENDQASDLLDELRSEYKRITDGIKMITKNTKCDSPLITSIGELTLLESYELQLKAEAVHERAILSELSKHDLWTHYLKDVRGVGPLMAGVIISEIDIHKCNSISALWKYCGLDVVVTMDEQTEQPIEEGRSRKKHHLQNKSYTNRDGDVAETVGITFNPFLKTKLVGVLGSVFMKLGGDYKEIYNGYKHRLENYPKHAEKTKLHRHNMAVRYMIKEFLADLWTEWRKLEGLEVRSRYAEEKLGIVHSKAA